MYNKSKLGETLHSLNEVEIGVETMIICIATGNEDERVKTLFHHTLLSSGY